MEMQGDVHVAVLRCLLRFLIRQSHDRVLAHESMPALPMRSWRSMTPLEKQVPLRSFRMRMAILPAHVESLRSR